VDLRRELERINRRGFEFYTRKLGEGVVWHEFNALESQYHGTYDEGGRRYTPGILVPVLWVIIAEAPRRLESQGKKAVPTVQLAASIQALTAAGMSNPTDSVRHLNDVFLYEGTLWEVNDYQIRGRLRHDVMVGVRATKVFAVEEMIFDIMPESIRYDQASRPIGYPNNVGLTFSGHPLPAANGEVPVFPFYGQETLGFPVEPEVGDDFSAFDGVWTWDGTAWVLNPNGRVVAVSHGSDADTPRPALATMVIWYGTVQPNNAQPPDIVILPGSAAT
jgi:hypothetical protein